MTNPSQLIPSLRRTPTRRFYALALALSLMLSKSVVFAAGTTEKKPASPPASSVAADPLAARILAMRSAFERRDWPQLAQQADRLRTLNATQVAKSPIAPLLPYSQYWLFVSQLNQSASNAVALSDQIDAFLDQHPDAPFAEWLRRDYLRALGKADAWANFQLASKTYLGDDIEVQCQRWRFDLAMQASEPNSVIQQRAAATALTQAKLLWESARGTSDACYTIFDRLQTDKRLNNVEVWDRVRRLLESGALSDARRSAPYASDLPKSFEPSTGSISLNPERYLKSLGAGQVLFSRPQIELVLYALSRLARGKADRAADWLAGRTNQLGPEGTASAWAIVATAATMQQNPNASAWFANADGAKLSDQQLGWRVRAALRTLPAASAEHSLSTWRIVKTSVTAMSPEERRDSAWRYWSARAEVALGELTAASSARQSLARENSFYGLLTAEELGIAPTFNWDTRAPKQDDLDAFAAKSATQRALSFYQLDLRNEGLREWQFAIRGLSDAQLIAAAELARAAGLPDRAIGTSLRTQQVHDYSQRFPLPHRDALSARAREYQLDEAFVYGLIRQESRFIASSVSHAGAIGLMQLMPATAKWAAKQVGIKNYAVSKVREIDTNLALGSFYLRHVLDDLGHAVLAAAAYNAGPSRAKRWRAERPLDGVIYAESIPFNETRDYVKQVMLNKWFYLQRLGVKNVSLKSIMGVVPGKSASTVSVALMQPPNVALPVTGVER